MITAKRKRDGKKHKEETSFQEAETRKRGKSEEVREKERRSFMVIEVVTGLASIFHLRQGYHLVFLCVCIRVCVQPKC